MAQRDEGGLALLYLDLDGFKAVNDMLGHACGDALLRQVGDRIRACLPEGASVARVGGDEFAVLLPIRSADLPNEAGLLARCLIERIERSYQSIGLDVPISCSIGIARAGLESTLHTVLGQADDALYVAKKRGGGCCVFGDELEMT